MQQAEGFQGISKPVNEIQREDESNEYWTRRLYTEKIGTQVLSRWCVHNIFAYGNVLDLLKIYLGKDCVETFVEHTEDEMNQLYATIPQ